MADTKRCTCTHAFQDKMYGKGVRVVTRSVKGEARCTVCGATLGFDDKFVVSKAKNKETK